MLTGPSHIRIGDTARFPLGRLGDEQVYRYRWTVTAFQGGSIVVRRLHDGVERTIAPQWFEQYRTEDCYRPKRYEPIDRSAVERLRRQRIGCVQHQTDPTQPGFYVSARKGSQYRLLLGPLTNHYDALQLVETARRIAQARYDDPYCEVAYGTCRAETSDRIGRFNMEVFHANA